MMKWRNQISIFKAFRYVFDKWTALERGCFSELNATKIQLQDKLKLVVLFSRWQILFTNSSGRFFYETSLACKTLSNTLYIVKSPDCYFRCVEQGLKHEKSYSIFFLDTLCAYEKTRKIRYDVVSIHFWWKPQSISWAMSVLALDLLAWKTTE